MANVKEINLDEVTKLEPNQILSDSIRQWRSDCQAGQFKIGSSHFRGSKLDMELVDADIYEGDFYGYPFQKWLAIVFIDPEGVLSWILFKTESLDQFQELYRSYRLKGESLLGKMIRAHMCKRASRANGNSYFAVEFEVVSDGKYTEAIVEFRQKHYKPGMIRLIESKPDTESSNGK